MSFKLNSEAFITPVVFADSAGAVVNTSSPTAPGTATATSATLQAGVYNSTLPTFTNGQQGAIQVDPGGNVRSRMVTGSATGADGVTNTLGYVVSTSSASSNILLGGAIHVFNGTTWDRQKKPNTVGRLVSAAGSTNATSVKATAGDLFEVIGYNAAATVRYLKLYNKASAPTVGTDTPVMTIALKPLDVFKVDFPAPLYFSTGIAYALTTGSADADTGALTAADVVGLNIVYQ